MKIIQVTTFLMFFVPTILTGCSEDSDVNTSLQDGAILNITPYIGGTTSAKPQEGLGSWFSMEISPGDFTFVPLDSLNGLIIGTIQLANTTSPPDGNIDKPWVLLGNFGAHQTNNNLNLVSTTSNSATIDFSGWGITWNSITNIDMSTGASSGGIDGIANLTCNNNCSNGNTYVLDYSATVPSSDPSGYGNVKYSLHLEGTINQ